MALQHVDGKSRRAASATRPVAAIARRRLLLRWILAGPAALAAAILIMAAMPVWLPPGIAGVDNIVYPIVLAPLIWAAVFVYAVLEENLARGLAVAAAVIAVMGAIVALSVAGPAGGA